MAVIPDLTIRARFDLFSNLLSFLSVPGLRELQAAIDVELMKRESE